MHTRIYWVILSAILCLFSFSLSVTGTIAQSKASKIDSLLQVAHQRGFFNGNALVAEKGTIVYQNDIGYADADRNRTLNSDLRFSIGSISKEFDGVALMLLAQQGLLSLDDSLQDYMPELPDWSQNIRLTHLLQYTSGIPSPGVGVLRSDDAVHNYLQMVDSLSFEPGSAYNYNNIDVFLRKKVVEAASGKQYNQFITDRILVPCGMSTAVIDATPDTPRMAFSFDNYFTPDVLDITTTGWVFVTTEDIYRWTQCLHSGELLHSEYLAQLFETHSASTQSPLGRAVYSNEDFIFQYHHGQLDNFEASLYVNRPEEFTILLLTNNRNSNVGDLRTAIDAILRGEPFEIPKKSIEMTLRTEILYNGYEQGLALFREILETERDIFDFDNEENELIETGEYLILKDKIEDAIGLLTFTANRFPQSSAAATKLGNAYLQSGQPDLARQSFELALVHKEDNEEAMEAMRRLATEGRE